MAYRARIVRDSLSPDGVRLTTMELTFPRIVLAEFNTHRVFSRNSASSRAIPVEKMLERAKNDPFIPIYWGKNQKGMQAEQELTPEERTQAEIAWLRARNKAVESAEDMLQMGVHKQLANRLLETFLWQTVLVTSTEWDNWEGLRCSKEAQPEIKRTADDAMQLLRENEPVPLLEGQWHLPLVDDFRQLTIDGFSNAEIVKICIGRCTRVSYLTHDGKRDPRADIELCDRLLSNGHMSPFEHAARPMTREDAYNVFSKIDGVTGIDMLDIDVTKVFIGNFRGWVQARKLIRNEDNFKLVQGANRTFELPAHEG